jgi:hypothetical protein
MLWDKAFLINPRRKVLREISNLYYQVLKGVVMADSGGELQRNIRQWRNA